MIEPDVVEPGITTIFCPMCGAATSTYGDESCKAAFERHVSESHPHVDLDGNPALYVKVRKDVEGNFLIGWCGKEKTDGCLCAEKDEHHGPEREFDPVNRPEHYASGSLECIDWIQAELTDEEFDGYLKGNILKYLWRYEDKGHPSRDLMKARWYLDRLIEGAISDEMED